MTLIKLTKDNWIKAFDEWIKTQHGTAGWEMKLENFISQVEKDAIERTRKECEDLHKNDSTPEEIRELMENVEKQAIEKTNKRWREKYLGWEKEVLKLATDKQYLKSLADVKSYGLTDLFEEKE